MDRGHSKGKGPEARDSGCEGPEEAGLWVREAVGKERMEADEGGGVGKGQTTQCLRMVGI